MATATVKTTPTVTLVLNEFEANYIRFLLGNTDAFGVQGKKSHSDIRYALDVAGISYATACRKFNIHAGSRYNLLEVGDK